MSDRQLRDLSIRKLTALAEKEELAAKKIKMEIEKFIEDESRPFYKDPSYVKLFLAGVSLSLILAAYIQYIFVPTQVRLTQKAETAEFTIQQNSAKHAAQVAKLELIQEQIKADSKQATEQLKAAINSLEEAQIRNRELKESLNEISENEMSGQKNSIAQMQYKIQDSEQSISQQLVQARESEIRISGLRTMNELSDKALTQLKGWVYIGYFPNAKWEHKTVDIDSGEPIIGQSYRITENVNLRATAPELSLLGYRFSEAIGYLLPEQLVKVISVTVTGSDRVWAEIETIN